MNVPDWFQTIAEISIGLAGFSGLVVALRKGSGPLSDIQAYRMRILITLAFGAMFLSLLPHVLAEFDVDENDLWIMSSLTMVIWSSFFLYSWISSSRRIAAAVPEIFNWYAFSTMATGHIINLMMQFTVIFSLLDVPPAGTLGSGLIWYLVHASQQFARMLFIQPREPRNDENQ